MRALAEQDLFEVLQIGFREDSYTELIANILENDQEMALEFLRQSFPDPPTSGPIRTETRSAERLASRKKVVPDLLVSCGDPASEMYVIEAKIEAGEGDRQTERYRDAQQALLARYPGAAAKGVGFLTLDGRAPKCNGVEPLTYEPLAALIDPTRFQHLPWMQTAVESLKARLSHYYRVRDEVAAGGRKQQSLAGLLKSSRGLVTDRDLFFWLAGRVGRQLGFEMESGVAQGVGTAYPLQVFYRPEWCSEAFPEACRLGDCFYIHLEVQLKGEQVVLMLHHETYPYQSNLSRTADAGEYERYWERRTRFARILEEEVDRNPAANGWRLNRVRDEVPAGSNKNQLAVFNRRFRIEESVGDFEEWLAPPLVDMTQVVERVRSRMEWD